MRLAAGIATLIAIATVAAYWGVWNHAFISFDDPGYVLENRHVQGGLTAEGLRWAVTTSAEDNWHPLTWVSHMLDCELFGVHAGAHHATNLILHLANALLLFWVLLRMTAAPGRSGFVAALFALHPLHVESVAWISERKDVLSTLFWMLTLWAYVRYAEHPRATRYVPMVAFLALGLLAKPMLVTIPFVLLLMDWWPLGRLERRERLRWPILGRLILEKAPLFLMVAISSVVTYSVQSHGGAIRARELLPLGHRLANAVVSYVEYVRKVIWPSDLAVFYPYPTDIAGGRIAVAALALAAVSVLAVLCVRRAPYLFVGWFFFLGTLVPVIGLVQVGSQSMADRYTYVPAVGLFLAASWGIPDLVPYRRWSAVALWSAGLAIGAGCVLLTRGQVAYWRDTTTLFRHALEVTQGNHLAHVMLGIGFEEQGRPLEESIAQYREALRIKSSFPAAHNNLGVSLTRQGRLAEAMEHYRKAIEIDPEYSDAHNNLGATLARSGQLEAARRELEAVVRLAPDDAKAHANLAFVLASLGRGGPALRHYAEAMRLRPGWSKPAIASAWILASYPDPSVQDGRRAVELAERLCRSTGETDAAALDVLSVAYAATGRFPEAAAAAEKALALATRAGQDEFAGQIRSRLERFRDGRPLRIPGSEAE